MGWKGSLRSIQASQRRAEREERRRQREIEKQRQYLAKMEELKRAAFEVLEYTTNIELLASVHKECSNAISWESFKFNPPQEPIFLRENEKEAQEKLNNYSPGLGDKLLKREDKKRKALQATVEEAIALDEKIHTDQVRQYKQDFAEWETTCDLAERILSGDLSAYHEAVRQSNPFDEIQELGTKIDINFLSSTLLEVELHVHDQDIIPTESKSLLKSGKLSIKQIPKSHYYAIYQDHVCGCLLRVARELFALLPLDMVIATAYGDLLNTKTGLIEKRPVVSVAFPRKTFNRLNFELLDPSDAMDNFIHNMKFLKTKGFQAVEVINPENIVID